MQANPIIKRDAPQLDHARAEIVLVEARVSERVVAHRRDRDRCHPTIATLDGSTITSTVRDGTRR